MFAVIDNSRNIEPLINVKNPIIKEGVNQYGPLSFLLPYNEADKFSYPMVDYENFIEFEGHEYRIKKMQKYLVKDSPVKAVQEARHRIYDLVDTRRRLTLSKGNKSINELLSFIFTGTRWNFSVIDSFTSEYFENFGNDTCLALFNQVVERFNVEFEIIGKEIRIRKTVGSYIDMQFRHGQNIKTFRENIDTTNLSTRIYGTGKQVDGVPVVELEYISPNAHLYKDDDGNVDYRDAPDYSNETITTESTLLQHLAKEIQDEPDVSMELEFNILQDAGYTKQVPERGDIVPTILEQLGVDVDLRIMDIERYPGVNRSPKVTLANHKKTFSQELISYQKSLLDKIYDENIGKLRYNVYDEAVKRATEALNNSLTELEYPEGMGIIARDPNDTTKFVVFRSSGLGITSNGGLTFEQAITAAGINTDLLTAGQIYTNNIQIIGNSDLFYWDGNYLIAIDRDDPNKFVRLNSDGLYIAKGAFTLEGKDGRIWVQDGIIRNSLVVQQTSPAFIGDNIELIGRYYRSSQSDYDFIGAYQMNHEGRYLIVEGYVLVGTAGVGIAVESYAGSTSFYQATTILKDTNSGIGGKPFSMIIDLGVPSYQKTLFYIKMRSDNAPETGGCRVNWVTQYG